jgi:hypothetical protein
MNGSVDVKSRWPHFFFSFSKSETKGQASHDNMLTFSWSHDNNHYEISETADTSLGTIYESFNTSDGASAGQYRSITPALVSLALSQAVLCHDVGTISCHDTCVMAIKTTK